MINSDKSKCKLKTSMKIWSKRLMNIKRKLMLRSWLWQMKLRVNKKFSIKLRIRNHKSNLKRKKILKRNSIRLLNSVWFSWQSITYTTNATREKEKHPSNTQSNRKQISRISTDGKKEPILLKSKWKQSFNLWLIFNQSLISGKRLMRNDNLWFKGAVIVLVVFLRFLDTEFYFSNIFFYLRYKIFFLKGLLQHLFLIFFHVHANNCLDNCCRSKDVNYWIAMKGPEEINHHCKRDNCS